MIVGVHNAELAGKIGRMNLARSDRSKLAGIVFAITDAQIGYFHLGFDPIFPVRLL